MGVIQEAPEKARKEPFKAKLPGNKFPEPIGTLGTGDHTLEHLEASGFPRRMCKKALRATGRDEQESILYIMDNVAQPEEFWTQRIDEQRWERNPFPSAASPERKRESSSMCRALSVSLTRT